MLAFYVNDLAAHLTTRQPNSSWEVRLFELSSC